MKSYGPKAHVAGAPELIVAWNFYTSCTWDLRWCNSFEQCRCSIINSSRFSFLAPWCRLRIPCWLRPDDEQATALYGRRSAANGTGAGAELATDENRIKTRLHRFDDNVTAVSCMQFLPAVPSVCHSVGAHSSKLCDVSSHGLWQRNLVWWAATWYWRRRRDHRQTRAVEVAFKKTYVFRTWKPQKS